MKKFIRFIAMAAIAATAFVACSKDEEKEDSNAISLNKSAVTLMETETFQLEVNNLPEGIRATFKSENAKVATVSSKGKITAKKEGETVINVTVAEDVLTCAVTVTAKPEGLVLIKGVDLGSAFSMKEGETHQLTATIDPSDATGAAEALKTIQYASDNESVATVSESGLVTAGAVAEGSSETAKITATVTYEEKEYSGSVTVTVNSAIVAITGVDLGSEITLTEGGTRQLNPSIVPSDATGAAEALKTIKYASADESVATVSATGLVTAQKVAEGETVSTTITGTVTRNGKEYSGTVRVNVSSSVIPTTGIVLSRTTLKLNPGESGTLEVTLNPSNHTDSPTVEWSTSDASVATVADGKVTAVDYGTATITASLKNMGLSATCSVIVQDGPKAATVIDMSTTYFEYTWPDNLASLENITLEAWVNIGESAAEQSFLGTEGVFLIRAQNGSYQAVVGGGSSSGWTNTTETVLSSTAEVGEWHHVAASYIAADKKFYLFIDGAQVAEGNSLLDGALPMNGVEGYNDGANPNIFMVGNGYGRNRFLKGNIAFARVWKKALTAEEITANMFKESVSDGDMVAYWKFTEGSGDTIHDYSGNGRDLTPVEGALNWVEGTLPAVQ